MLAQGNKLPAGIASLRDAIAAEPELAQAYRALGKASRRAGDAAAKAQLATEYQARFGAALPEFQGSSQPLDPGSRSSLPATRDLTRPPVLERNEDDGAEGPRRAVIDLAWASSASCSSTDLRARAAEAAGDPDTAATHYGLAGDRAGAVRMHLARAARAADRAAELAALRDAVHWAGDEPALVAQASRRWAARCTPRQGRGRRHRARSRAGARGGGAARAGGAHREAGDALAAIGELAGAAQAYPTPA
jgi:hypothetical protein